MSDNYIRRVDAEGKAESEWHALVGVEVDDQHQGRFLVQNAEGRNRSWLIDQSNGGYQYRYGPEINEHEARRLAQAAVHYHISDTVLALPSPMEIFKVAKKWDKPEWRVAASPKDLDPRVLAYYQEPLINDAQIKRALELLEGWANNKSIDN